MISGIWKLSFLVHSAPPLKTRIICKYKEEKEQLLYKQHFNLRNYLQEGTTTKLG